MRARLLELALLLAAVAAPLLAVGPWPAVAVAALGVAWLALRPPRREAVATGGALAVAAALLLASWLVSRAGMTSRRGWTEAAAARYSQLWQDLRQTAAGAREALEDLPPSREGIRSAFARLDARVRGEPESSILLLDRYGEAVAWAGPGLLQEPASFPRSGPHFQAGFTAVTLMMIEPLGAGRDAGRIVAGRSFGTDRLPFRPPGRADPGRFRWSLVGEESSAAPEGTLVLRSPGVPAMVVAPPPGLFVAGPEPDPLLQSAAWWALGFGLLALAVVRGLGQALPRGLAGPRRAPVAGLAVGGLVAWGLAAGVPGPALGVLAAGVGLATLRLAADPAPGAEGRPGPGRPGRDWVAAVAGVAAALTPWAAAWVYQRFAGPLDLASSLPLSPRVLSLSAGLGGAAFGLLWTAGTGPAERRRGDGWAWAAVGLLLASGAAADLRWLALPLLAGGGAALALWLRDRSPLARVGVLGVLALSASLVAAAGWEVAFRDRLKVRLGDELLPRMAAPTPVELTAAREELARHFSELDLASLAPRPTAGMDRQDLAFAAWRRSPLARRSALSALALVPREGQASVFSFGMPISEEHELDTNDRRFEEQALAADETLVAGTAPVTDGGRPWGEARWWLLPRPGFRLAERSDAGEVLLGLLRGAPQGPGARPEGLPEPALYGYYSPQGRALISPWEESPPSSELGGGEGSGSLVRTPAGPAWVFSRSSPAGREVLYLPVLFPSRALERIGTHAVGMLLFLAAATLLALLVALPRAAFRDLLGTVWRSYSKRLLLVYTSLLLVPLVLLNVVVLRIFEQRLERDQRAEGERALISAQRVLGERLQSLPGVALTTELNDQLLTWLSRAVHHEVNLYFGAELLASSKPELFTAGLLPRRIPGEVFSRLVLAGYNLSNRTNRVVDTPYLELYGPLGLPGVPIEQVRLFVSVPLLTQQEEASQVLAGLRRRTLVATAALFALLVAVGSRLARSFTTPLKELVEGTQRIAAGAPRLGLSPPAELELAALMQAVDDMAARIAEGRERLLREKALVERVVENITSGVVSLDAGARVLMHNRVASTLLGVEAGQSLEEVLARSEHLAPVADFVARAAEDGREPRRATVRLPGGEAGEWEWTLVWAPLPGRGEPAALLVMEDVTEMLRGQRLAAWAEMARIIAHEIKNPLTPVRLSAEHMRQVWKEDPEHFGDVFERCTANILRQVDELQAIASEFSTYSRIPRAELKSGDLRRVLEQVVEGYLAAPPPGVEVRFEAPAESLPARFDERLLSRAVRNLLENAVRASAGGGRVEVRLVPADGSARIAVADTGPGVAPELLGRIFDPYFSTHDAGTGLGLPIARRIAEEHGGEVTARNRPEGGLEVEIRIPLS